VKAVAVYARVSSEQQAQQATIDSQMAALKERVAADGHPLLPEQIYLDDGVSGTTLLRPALERLRDRVAEGSLDRIYVHSPDRLARKYAYQVLLLDEFRARGVTVIFLNAPSSRSAEDELLVQVQGIIAEYERAKILERSRRGKIFRARQGLVNPIASAPYGYLYVKKSDAGPASFKVLLHQAKVVRWMFNAIVHEHKSIASIVRTLNAQKTPTRRAARWHCNSVHTMLRNPAYMGKAAFGRTEQVEREPRLRPVRGTKVQRSLLTRAKPPDQWILVDVPAIVSADIFEAAQQQLARNRRLSQRNGRGNRYLLQGLTVCALCGYAFYGKTSNAGTKPYSYYRCLGTDGHRYPGGAVCSNPLLRSSELDDFVWGAVRELLEDPERLIEEWSHRANAGETQGLRAQRDDAARLLAAQERGLRRLVDAYEAGAIDVDDLKTRSDAIRTRIERSREEISRANHHLDESVRLRAVVTRMEDFGARIRSRLHDLPWLERRRLIRTVVAKVEIDHETATVVYRVAPPTTSKTPRKDEVVNCIQDASVV
jgi:site-specific DNA recombinase